MGIAELETIRNILTSIGSNGATNASTVDEFIKFGICYLVVLTDVVVSSALWLDRYNRKCKKEELIVISVNKHKESNTKSKQIHNKVKKEN